MRLLMEEHVTTQDVLAKKIELDSDQVSRAN